MKTFTLIALFSFALTSCSSRVVQNDDEREAFNSIAVGKTGKIQTTGQWQRDAKQIRIDGHYITYMDEAGKTVRCIVDSVETIMFIMNRGQAGIKAAGIVFGVCVIIGLASQSSYDGESYVSPAQIWMGAGVLLSPVGFLIGYLSGENVYYTFQ